jgi:hypothetical protein
LAYNRSEDTISINAGISCAQVVVITNYGRELASFHYIARTKRTFVSIITNNRSVLNSIFNRARIFSACIVIIDFCRSQRNIETSGNRIASIGGAWIVIIAINWRVDALLLIA